MLKNRYSRRVSIFGWTLLSIIVGWNLARVCSLISESLYSDAILVFAIVSLSTIVLIKVVYAFRWEIARGIEWMLALLIRNDSDGDEHGRPVSQVKAPQVSSGPSKRFVGKFNDATAEELECGRINGHDCWARWAFDALLDGRLEEEHGAEVAGSFYAHLSDCDECFAELQNRRAKRRERKNHNWNDY
ncbi:MAG: hypothetical protein Q7R62_02420 [bacterium]|nr:hypothetical protein [bacterium]